MTGKDGGGRRNEGKETRTGRINAAKRIRRSRRKKEGHTARPMESVIPVIVITRIKWF